MFLKTKTMIVRTKTIKLNLTVVIETMPTLRKTYTTLTEVEEAIVESVKIESGGIVVTKAKTGVDIIDQGTTDTVEILAIGTRSQNVSEEGLGSDQTAVIVSIAKVVITSKPIKNLSNNLGGTNHLSQTVTEITTRAVVDVVTRGIVNTLAKKKSLIFILTSKRKPRRK